VVLLVHHYFRAALRLWLFSGLRASFHTLGCRLNQAETATISATFAARGYTIVESGAETDVHMINTCSVTEGAGASICHLWSME
jgi:tRNA A37 methylthiotransferase MiaB